MKDSFHRWRKLGRPVAVLARSRLMKRLSLTMICALLVIAAGSASGAPTAPPLPPTFGDPPAGASTVDLVDQGALGMAADGPRVAVIVYDDRTFGGHAIVWNALTGRKAQYSWVETGDGCDGTNSVGLAGPWIAWACEKDTMSTRQLSLFLRRPARKAAQQVDAGLVPQAIGNVAADGDLLVYNRPPRYSVWRVDPHHRLSRITGGVQIEAVDHQRIVGLKGRTLVVLSSDGRPLWSVRTSCNRLVALLERTFLCSSGRELTMRDLRTGHALRDFRLAGEPGWTDAEGTLFVYTMPDTRQTIRLLRLTDGRDRAIAHPSSAPTELSGLDIEPDGLFYAIPDDSDPTTVTRVVFVPKNVLGDALAH
jgi:mRNA-degrading endonuclease toxin of MazEF toxin-antitoxin module